jgi:membrane protein YqaA with SNARE-associated domain
LDELLLGGGLSALFLLSFAAATLAPVGSEWLLVILLLRGTDPTAAVLTATAGNFLGACTTYLVGATGARWLERRVAAAGSAGRRRAEHAFQRFGSWALLFSWVPFLGDALCLVAGAVRLNFARFSALVAVGKLARYAAIALALPS